MNLLLYIFAYFEVLMLFCYFCIFCAICRFYCHFRISVKSLYVIINVSVCTFIIIICYKLNEIVVDLSLLLFSNLVDKETEVHRFCRNDHFTCKKTSIALARPVSVYYTHTHTQIYLCII